MREGGGRAEGEREGRGTAGLYSALSDLSDLSDSSDPSDKIGAVRLVRQSSATSDLSDRAPSRLTCPIESLLCREETRRDRRRQCPHRVGVSLQQLSGTPFPEEAARSAPRGGAPR